MFAGDVVLILTSAFARSITHYCKDESSSTTSTRDCRGVPIKVVLAAIAVGSCHGCISTCRSLSSCSGKITNKNLNEVLDKVAPISCWLINVLSAKMTGKELIKGLLSFLASIGHPATCESASGGGGGAVDQAYVRQGGKTDKCGKSSHAAVLHWLSCGCFVL